jgi:hypothetical protein
MQLIIDNICPYTQKEGFPHHWECIHMSGHPNCTCHGSEYEPCDAYECTIIAGLRRRPDGSYVHKEFLKSGGIIYGNIFARELPNGEFETKLEPF